MRNAFKGYGRYLAVLDAAGKLDISIGPAERVTRENMEVFVAALRASGNSNNTIAARLWEVRTALRIMVPDADHSWLTEPAGALRACRDTPRRQARFLDSRTLYKWGCDLMDGAAQLDDRRRRIEMRNGLLIAILAARAPRLKTIAAFRLGVHVLRHGDAYRLVLPTRDMKAKRLLEFDLPSGLTGYIDRYIQVERQELLAGRDHDHFWVGQGGTPLDGIGISQIIRRQSERRFGEVFGPHRFRYALGTSAPIADPAHPLLGAAILGNSPTVFQKYYNIGGQQEASAAFQRGLREEREKLQGLAERLFR